MKLLSDVGQRKNDNFVIFVNFCDASTRSKKFRLLYLVHQIENFYMAVGPEYKLEENEDIKRRNRSLRLVKSVSKCGFLILFTK